MVVAVVVDIVVVAVGQLGRNLSRVVSPDQFSRVYIEGRILPSPKREIMALRVDIVEQK